MTLGCVFRRLARRHYGSSCIAIANGGSGQRFNAAPAVVVVRATGCQDGMLTNDHRRQQRTSLQRKLLWTWRNRLGRLAYV